MLNSLTIIGGGVMGEAILARLLAQGVVAAANVMVAEPVAARRDQLASDYAITCSATNREAVEEAETVVLAVKPQTLKQVFSDLSGTLVPDQLVFSIIAGVTLRSLTKGLDHAAVVRVMPNTPAQIGLGMSMWTATSAVTDAQKTAALEVLYVLGDEIYAAEEHYLDMATAVSGSGPAYVFLVLEALTDAGVHIGLSREVAERMALQTLVGSSLYAKETGAHPAVLRNQVTSPGGTTTEALQVMEDGALRSIFIRAVEAAYLKSQALGNKQED